MGSSFDWSSLPAIALASVVLLVLLRLIRNALPGRTPPVFEGLPFVGGILKFMKGPTALVESGYKACGEVFTVPVLHKQITFLVGPHVSGHFFKAHDAEMSQEEVYRFNVPTFGPGVVFDVHHRARTDQFKAFTEALKAAKMKDYVPLFVKEAEEFFGGRWGDEGVVNLIDELSELVILTASRTLLGREIREQMFAQVKDLIHQLDLGMLPITVLFPYLPIPAHRNRDRAREELGAIYKKIVDARRAAGTTSAQERDMMQTFIESKYTHYEGGRYFNDSEICGLLIAVLFAGQHTSSITSSWTGYFMLTHQEKTLVPAVAEQEAIIAKYGAKISLEALNEMEVLHRNIQEAVRLYPPLIMLMRQVHKDFTVTTSTGKTYTVPKGHIAATSVSYAHRMPGVFAAADEYQPDRYLPPREEDKQRPFSYIGFGGGRHGCLGTNFAYLQIKTIWSVMLRNFEFEMVDPFPEPDLDSMVVGPKPCRIRYRRRQQPLC